MLFSLINAPATFQAYINYAMAGLLNVICVVYLDDILIYFNDLKNHVKHIQIILNYLKVYKLYVKLLKCCFNIFKVSFLSFYIGFNDIAMEPDRIFIIIK